MKRRGDSSWFLWGLLGVAILAFVWYSGGMREMFSSSNPVLSQADVDSMKTSNGNYVGSPSTNALTAMNWAKSNIPWPSGTTDSQKQEIIYFNVATFYDIAGGDKFASFVSSLPSSVTPDTVIPQFYTWLKANASFTGNETFTPTFIGLVKKGQPTVNTIDDINWFYWLYVYLFGVPSSPSSSTPSPAASSSTQPMTVGIPTPCRPQYKSIPGGSMEFKCFS
jgi:hypothetical protein